ncbi:MFS transporter [Reinekea forsetii]|nr:MFS transporter [Reinekea forsetii]
MTLSNIRYFPLQIWVVLIGTFLTRAAFFMVWPFMAVILNQRFEMSEAVIGFILSLSALASAFFSLYVGYLSDKLGRKGLMMLGCVTYVVAFIILAISTTAVWVSVGAMMVGMSRSMLETPARAMISDLLEDKEIRDLAHQVRYYMVNVGASMGPILGLYLGFTGAQTTFWFVALTYALYGFGFMYVFHLVKNEVEPPKSELNFQQTLTVLRQDRSFLLLILANMFVMYSYMHQETSLVQHLNQLGDRVVDVYTPMILINGVIIIVFQFPLLKLMSAWPLTHRAYFGLSGFALAFLMYAFTPLDAPVYWWFAGATVLAIGEVVLFPTFNLFIDRAAPAHMRGSYFGAGSLAAIGVSLSPLIGGIILQFFGGTALFVSTAFVCVIAGIFYHLSDKQRRLQSPVVS